MVALPLATPRAGPERRRGRGLLRLLSGTYGRLLTPAQQLQTFLANAVIKQRLVLAQAFKALQADNPGRQKDIALIRQASDQEADRLLCSPVVAVGDDEQIYVGVGAAVTSDGGTVKDNPECGVIVFTLQPVQQFSQRQSFRGR